ncbi:hydroxyectoine utilization dehydratase EutB [Pelagibacterium xiamenense]|uniref:hydroxyectoine utilization dehydratase EutB n=1 Tax=Pelagibacterium xiamenense TaxID=2901140 RepID=UPI001E54A5FA|nr:hydroxyectoine utilization dehydratase EutB [Pelagibacterium xiamenense]MCD7059378.1 hydroxyectoine utilization dehydratase EutB [Pelagibacterium xiamenense]
MGKAVAFTDILAAANRLAPHIRRTPVETSLALTERVGHPVHLKLEHHQITGSFKLRGATNAVLGLPEKERKRGVSAASTGNHGRAVSHAAKATGTRAIICMSSLVPANKVEAIAALGAEARIVGKSQDDAQVEVDRLVAEEGFNNIPPFDHPDVIAGQGTIGLEFMAALPDLDAILVPLSGGGLISGIALAVKTMSPKTRVVGVSMERGAAMVACLAAGHPVDVEEVATLADSLGGGIGLDNRLTFNMVRDLVDETILVSESEIAEAVRFAYEFEREVLEGGAAVGIAALMSGKFEPRGPTGLVLTGRNIDTRVHREIICGTHPAFEEA